MNARLLSAIAAVAPALMLVAVIKMAYVPGLGFLTFLVISIPISGVLTLVLWAMRKRESSQKRFFDGQFYFVGSLVCFVVLTLLGVQMFRALTDSSKAVETAEKQVRTEFPGLAWALEELEKCDKGLEPYSNVGYLYRANCDLAVADQAKKRGVESDLTRAFERRGALIRANQPEIPWPLSIL